MIQLAVITIYTLIACVLSDPVAVIPVEYGQSNGSDHRRSGLSYWKLLLYSAVNHETLKNVVKNHSDYNKRQPYPHALHENIFPASLTSNSGS